MDTDNDLAWIAEAERRLDEIRSGKVAPVPADDVFAARSRKGDAP